MIGWVWVFVCWCVYFDWVVGVYGDCLRDWVGCLLSLGVLLLLFVVGVFWFISL